jgi:hypothetical protein
MLRMEKQIPYRWSDDPAQQIIHRIEVLQVLTRFARQILQITVGKFQMRGSETLIRISQIVVMEVRDP